MFLEGRVASGESIPREEEIVSRISNDAFGELLGWIFLSVSSKGSDGERHMF